MTSWQHAGYMAGQRQHFYIHPVLFEVRVCTLLRRLQSDRTELI